MRPTVRNDSAATEPFTWNADDWDTATHTAPPSMRFMPSLPPYGLTRVQCLTQGLDPAWQLEGTLDSEERKRGLRGTWAFTAHLLTSQTRWAVAVIWDHDWTGNGAERDDVLAAALGEAVVEDGVAGLVRRFATGTGLPSATPRSASSYGKSSATSVREAASWPEARRMEVLDFLLGYDFPGKAGEVMLLDLSFGAGAIGEERRAVEARRRERALYETVVRRFRTLAEHAASAGLLNRGEGKIQSSEYRLRGLVSQYVEGHGALLLGPDFVDIEEQVYVRYFGEVLNDARVSLLSKMSRQPSTS